MRTKFDDSCIGHLETEKGEKCYVWLMPRLVDDLQEYKLLVFVRPEGLQ